VKLQELIARSTRLQGDVRRLDTTMHTPSTVKVAAGNPVEKQWGLLKAAFERDGV
jgi:regulator of CtrA degradation